MRTTEVEIAGAFRHLFEPPLGGVRYRVTHGGRGSAKSWQKARALLIHGYGRPLRILCAREYQASIRESVHRLLKDQISALGYDGFYHVGTATITGLNGTEFIFKGLRHNPQEIKSTEGIDICWVEEAEAVSEASWNVLTPTVRKPGSEIWVSFNPALEDDPTYKRFVSDPPADAIIREVSWRDNPWLDPVLRAEREDALRRDPELEAHIWGGKPWVRSKAQVLADKVKVLEFEPAESWSGPYYGLDFGFAQTPSALVRLWVHDSRLMMEYCDGGLEWDNDEHERRIRDVPGADRHMIRADSARPESINELVKRGLTVEPAPKWQGSVEDGIAHLRTYDAIVLHPRCTLAIKQARLYRYRTDPRTEDVLPHVQKGNDDVWDATRYALAPLIQKDTRPRGRVSRPIGRRAR